MIEDLQTKLSEASQHGSLARLGAVLDSARPPGAERIRSSRADFEALTESEADLERQLADYFDRSSPPTSAAVAARQNQINTLEDLRGRVIDGVVDRILDDWACGRMGEAGALRAEVLERLIERVLLQFRAGSAPQPEALPS